MKHELKKAIIIWLLDNPNAWQRVNACTEQFRPYIFGPDHNFLEFGGEEVFEFIKASDTLIYKSDKLL